MISLTLTLTLTLTLNPTPTPKQALLPLQPQLLKLIDASYLRGEDVLSPVFAP